MFDIVSGRETRAAVLLAGFAPDRKVRKQPIDIDGLRLSMESQFNTAQRELGLCERVSRQIYANALQRPFP